MGKRAHRLIAVLLGLTVGVALAVVGWYRWQRERPIYLQEPGHQLSGHRYLHDPLLGWRNIPGWQATTNGRKLSINSRGLRDREYTLVKPPGVLRMLVLGDSYTWGYGVADHEIYTEVLEARLRAERASAGGAVTGGETDRPRPPSREVQVINSGVSGWGTDQQYLFLRSEGLAYAPDLVLLALFLVNDPENNVHSVQYGLAKPYFTDLKLTPGNQPVPRPDGSRPTAQRSSAESLDLTVAIIQAIDRLCERGGCQLVVMKFGCFPGPVPAGIRSWEQRLEQQLKTRLPRVPYLDLDRRMADSGIPNERLIRGNREGHWNALGHKEVARHLYDFLVQQELLE